MPQLTVAKFLETTLAQCGKSQTAVAKQLGYRKPNIISMFKSGQTKVPLETVGPLAIAIGADPVFLLKLTMQEYHPETYKAIEPHLAKGQVISVQEAKLVQMMRDVFMGNQIDLEDPRIESSTRQLLCEIAERQMSSEAAARDRYDRSPANARDYG